MRAEHVARLVRVARWYYEDGVNQSGIAARLGISRPLVSRLLSEARAAGIVEIRIRNPEERRESLVEAFLKQTGLSGCILAADGRDDGETNRILVGYVLDFIDRNKPRTVGIGWGHFIGEMVEAVQEKPRRKSGIVRMCPLLGNAGIPVRFYQSNENVRLLADGLGAAPAFLYLPALAESVEEKKILCSTGLYRQMEAVWETMDAALINIGNYPSTPDFASSARFGPLLSEKHACGRFLAYVFNEKGEVIQSDQDPAIQIPLPLLRQCPLRIGLCSANTSLRALRGALRTGFFTHIAAREALVEELLRDDQPLSEGIL